MRSGDELKLVPSLSSVVQQDRPLRVLWLIDHVCYDGSLHGGGRLFYNLLPEFDPTRVQVFPYFLRSSEEVQRVFADAPVPVTVLHLGKHNPLALWAIRNLCRQHQIDVMHLFCYASSTFGRLVSVWTGIPAIIHDFDTQIYFPYPLYLKVLDRVLARRTGRALAASPLCRAYMRDVRNVPGDRIELLLHAIPARCFAMSTRTEQGRARASLGWQQDAVIFCAVTKLGPERGNEYLLQAFARVAAARPNTRLMLVYKPTYYHRVPEAYAHLPTIHDAAYMQREIKQLASALGIAARVEFVEALDEPEQYIVASDVLVVPFLNERFSSVNLLEAFAYGRPAIATDIGEQREVIQEGHNGLLVPPGDEEALAAAMLRLVDDSSQRQQMGLAATALAQQYSVTATAERLTNLYAELAACRAARTSTAITATRAKFLSVWAGSACVGGF
jgi:glycosyltransferase involved in cell wall biosynthesis